MNKLSEVVRIVGVTRRALQGYCEIGLLCPTEKTEGGYWLYDNDAINKLILIQTFIEVGYKRQTIKSLLESPNLDLYQEYDRVIEKLTAKRKRLDGMINAIKAMKLTEQIPESILRSLSNIDIGKLYQNKSFKRLWDESTVAIADIEDIDSDEAKQGIPISALLCLLGQLHNEDVSSENVQNCVNSICELVLETFLGEDDSYDDYNKADISEFLLETMSESSNDPEALSTINNLLGAGSTDFIVKALKQFHENALKALEK